MENCHLMCPSVLEDAKEGSQKRSLKTAPTELKHGTYPATATERAEMWKTHLPWPLQNGLQTELPSAHRCFTNRVVSFTINYQYFLYGFRILAVEPLPQQQFSLFLPGKNRQWFHFLPTCHPQLSAHSPKPSLYLYYYYCNTRNIEITIY